MNKRIGAAILTAVLTMALVPAAAFAYTGEEGSSSETGVIVREIPAEEVDETEETSATGTTSTGSSDQSGDIRNEDGSVTQSSSTTSVMRTISVNPKFIFCIPFPDRLFAAKIRRKSDIRNHQTPIFYLFHQ